MRRKRRLSEGGAMYDEAQAFTVMLAKGLKRLFGTLLLAAMSMFSMAAESTPPGALVITQSPWQQRHTEFLAKPASLMKLVTATAAWETLGPDFRFATQLRYQRIDEHQGRVQLSFSGDPTLRIDDLLALFHQLKARGVSQITALTIDDSLYAGHPWGTGQVWNDHGICFAAPTTAIIVNHNCIRGNLKPTQVGQPARLYMADYAGVAFTNHVITQAPGEPSCEALHQVTSDNHFTLSGCIDRQRHVLPLAFSVVNVRAYLTAIIQRMTASQGIEWTGQPTFAAIDQVLYPQALTHQSAPLTTLLHRMLKRSDNLIADSLFKQLGAQHYGTGTYHNSAEVVWQVLADHQIARRNQVIQDGSGLSRENLLYASTLYQVLTLWRDDPAFSPLIDFLPVAGRDGTLKYRRSVLAPTLKGHIQAKTGSMAGVSNLAGYVRTSHGLSPFVLIANQVSADDDAESAIKRMTDYETAWLLKGYDHVSAIEPPGLTESPGEAENAGMVEDKGVVEKQKPRQGDHTAEVTATSQP